MILDFIKDFLRGPDGEFKKLTPDYFLRQRTKMTTEEYAKWLLKQFAYYSSMARIYEEKRPLPSHYIAGLDLLKSEIEKIRTQGMSRIITNKMIKNK